PSARPSAILATAEGADAIASRPHRARSVSEGLATSRPRADAASRCVPRRSTGRLASVGFAPLSPGAQPDAHRTAFESEALPQLVLEKADVRGLDGVGIGAEHDEGRRADGD